MLNCNGVVDVQRELIDYIDNHRHTPFKWGTHDCLTFADGVYEITHGTGFASGWTGNYDSSIAAKRFFDAQMKKEGFTDFSQAMDARLTRGVGFPPSGAIVGRNTDDGWTEYVLGVAVSVKAAFVGLCGLEFSLIRPTDLWWK